LNNSGGEKAPGQKNGGGEASKGAAAEPVHRVTPEGGGGFSSSVPGIRGCARKHRLTVDELTEAP
jgi:hypothetical protein